MAIFRVDKTGDYTVMGNHHLRDKNLSLKAIGLLSKMLSLPDDWDYSMNGLVAICKEKKASVTSALNELKENGYVVITKLMPDQTESGRIEYVYDVFEKPHTEYQGLEKTSLEKTSLEKQDLERQDLEKSPQLNTNRLNTYRLNTDNKPNTKDIRGDKPPTPTKRTRFTPPTVEEVEDYCRERDNGIDAEHFIDYYEARGWELSKGRKVKDWKACVRTWERNNRSKPARKAGEGKPPEPKERLNLESIIRTLPEESQDAVREYVTMRERTNHPIATENTLIRAIKKAKEFAGDDTGKFTRIFEQSTDHSWQGVYDLKEDNAAKENTERKSVNPKDYDFSTLEGYEEYIKATGFWG